MSIDLGSQQLAMQNKQPTPSEPISNNLGSQKLSVSNKRMTQMVSTLISPSSQKNSNPSKRMTQMASMPKNQGSHQSLLQTKRMSRSETMPTNPGSQQSPASNKRNAQPSPKGQAESSESVRAKLRETLADSLSLVCKQENQAVGENSQDKAASTLKPCNENSSLPDTTISADVSSCHRPENPSNDEDGAHKPNSSQSSSQEVLSTDSKEEVALNMKCDTQDFQFNYVLPDEDVPFGNNLFIKDELLQENGLCWASDLELQAAQSEEIHYAKRPRLTHEEIDRDGKSQPSLQDLATKIEAELFKLYGGVNKKYKEKGRSLLFNLKDRNNPELRERVLSGEITPERLCSMTAEELASKELSEWRIAKAEELAHMIVLPDSDVDVRRLVKKTHKGEFQVEFEQDDSGSVEVAVGSSLLTQVRPKIEEKEAHASSKLIESRASEASIRQKVKSADQNLQSGLTTLPDDGADLMQGLMVDELKDAEFLPPIVSLDEFMESLDSEPPFENLPVESGTVIVNSDENDSPDVASKLESSDLGSICEVDTGSDEPEKPQVDILRMDTNLKSDHIDGETETPTTVSTSKQDVKPNHVHRESEKFPSSSTPKLEHVWEGLLQLNVSSMVTVIGSFKSGERTSAKEWTSFLDVKGRVRLDAFEKFLQELPMSRSRAIMIVHFCWKEGTPESGRVNLCEVVDSYVADDRVGFAEPAPGVELYLCPPRGKTSEMLRKHLSNDHVETLNAINDGLIGIVVWRKAHVTSTISPNSFSHHKHHAARKQSSVRRQEEMNAHTNISKEHPLSQFPAPSNPEPLADDEDDDLPPGFGPGAAAARDEDDLPEFDFARGSGVSHFPTTKSPKGPFKGPSPTVVQQSPRPVDQVRELIHKYGRGGEVAGRGGVDDDDDDDIPEWQPQSLNQPMAPPQQHLPPPPPPPSLAPPPPLLAPQLVHNFQQPNLPPHMFNQPPLPFPLQYPQYPNPNQQLERPMAVQHMQTMSMMQGQQNVNHPWPQQQQQQQLVPPFHGLVVPNFGGQPFAIPSSGFVASQNGSGEWRLDVNKSRGF